MNTLPLEVLGKIIQDLTPDELVACSAVSVGWRDAFNQDSLWRPLCNEDTAEYLETAECRVEPRFESPESEDGTLSPVCRWRMCYMRETHLRKTWRWWNCIKDDIPVKDLYLNDMYNFVSNDLVINTQEDSNHKVNVSLWNVKSVPVRLGNPFSMSFNGGDIILVSDKCSVIVKIHHVEVYNCELSCDLEWPMRYFFFVGGTETYLSGDKDKILTNDNVQECIKSYYFTGTYFVYITTNNSDLHIWDLNVGTELNRVKFPVYDELVPAIESIYNIIKSENDSKDFVLVQSYEAENVVANVFRVYSLNRLQFLPFQVRHDFPYQDVKCILLDQFVAVADTCGPVHLYNYMTSELIVKVSTTSSDILAFGRNILIYEEGRMHVKFDCRTLKVEPFPVTDLNESTSKYQFEEYLLDRILYAISKVNILNFSEGGSSFESDDVTWITEEMYMLENYKTNKSHTKFVFKCFSNNQYLLKVITFW
ncbi:uncharacterized protein LOC124364087 [Homalodisca vitripennis]|uniref:uncharacterized protein LOC124364087 n=1 Tax=Homalodisca vitripennis TaxID=197043 RepID=UPI001EECEB85|nr:uncharacterized protein LOC124364087 [Homalodisca vitripennis]